MSLIRLENVSLARQGKTLLSNLDWTVEKGTNLGYPGT